MLRNGSYSAWFRTPQGEGTGVVVLNDGKMIGGDTVIAYTGSYVEEGDTFTVYGFHHDGASHGGTTLRVRY
jgi:hypothetical protein